MDVSGNTDLSDAVRDGRWNEARHLAAIRIATAMERTESAREIKSLSISLDRLLGECERNGVGEEYDTPLAQILREADEQDRKWRQERDGAPEE